MFVRVHTEEEVYDLWDAGWLYKMFEDTPVPVNNRPGAYTNKEHCVLLWKKNRQLSSHRYGYVTED